MAVVIKKDEINMITYTVTDKTLIKTMKYVTEQAKKSVLNATRRAAVLGVPVLQRATDTAKPYPAVNTGILRNSWRVVNIDSGAILGSPEPHAIRMELGVRANRIPAPGRGKVLFPIVLWAYRKFRVNLVIKSKTKERRLKKGVLPSWAWNLGAKIQKKLHKKGITPRYIMKKSQHELKNIWVNEVNRAIKK